MTGSRGDSTPSALVGDAARLGQDARGWLDDVLDDAIAPGLADVVMRARRFAPQRLDDELVAEATALDELDDARTEAAGRFGSLQTFLADARAHAEEVAAHAVPDAAAPAPVRRGSSRRLAVALVALAAVAILVPVMGWVVSARVLDPAAEPAYSSASDRMARDDDPQEATTIEPQPEPAPRLRTVAIPETPTPAPDPEPIEIEDAIDDAPPAERATSPRGKPAAPGPGKAERLRTLDAEARAAWSAGDLPVAEAKFSELVRIGGRSSLVDIAYGDLFSVLRQRGHSGDLPRHWRRYVARFPRGRYVDEARAGLCRAAAPSEEIDCWRAYLRDRPDGTYRQHARDIVKRGG